MPFAYYVEARIHRKSSTIHKVSYDDKEKTLEIEFRSGNVYRYKEVPPRCGRCFNCTSKWKARPGHFLMNTSRTSFPPKKFIMPAPAMIKTAHHWYHQTTFSKAHVCWLSVK
jgi:lysyl-tRNA synthetase class 2